MGSIKSLPEVTNRREFLRSSALGFVGLTIIPSWRMAGNVYVAPSDRVIMGFIGLGQQSMSDGGGFFSLPGVQIAACCDVDQLKQLRFKRRFEKAQKEKGMNPRCDVYEFYEDLLERKDIDAISIATPDHWHALMTIHACQNGKDVYVQKPLAFTVTEGFAMVKAVRDNNRILQVGSQQRSSWEFQKAIELVRNGHIGSVEKIFVNVGEPPKSFDLPEMPIPSTLNFNKWLGPLNDRKIHYHQDLCPPISVDPREDEKLWGAWRWYRETGNGYTADWGAHMFDIAQAAIGMDGSGPCEFIPKGYNGTEFLTMKYQNGIVMTEQPLPFGKGIKFFGTKGWIEVMRGRITCSDPSLSQDEGSIKVGGFEFSSSHTKNLIDSIRNRKDPIAPVEVGCSTNTLCCIANIATEIKRSVKWNPATLSFGDDKEAASHRLNYYEYRNPYSLNKSL